MEIEFWEGENGKCPVRDFLREECEKKPRRKLSGILDNLEKEGFSLLGSIFLKKVNKKHGIFSIRWRGDGITYRILFVVAGGVAWMLVGFRKKTEEIPERYMETAIARKLAINM